ncbi:MAG: FAD:protein FMN transferase [Flavobacteriaceae bacterium]|nr:FAD:protein FMN transferase [Flavobacteriaceae bacterium]
MKALLKYKNGGISLIFLALVACQEQKDLVFNSYAGGALGTNYSILFFADEKLNLEQEIDSVFQDINFSMSTYIPESDISRINSGDHSIIVDAMFREVLELSKRIHAETGGYFDPTVGILVNAWGFGPGEMQELDSTKVDSLLRYVGLEKVVLKADRTIKMESEGMQLDFNAIAKGYAIDRLGVFLEELGIEDFLVEVGGEVITLGINQDKQKEWTVGIDDPQVEFGRRLKLAIRLKDRAMASSGNYRKFRIDSVTGMKYVHTIDPKTGFTINSNTLGATVLAASCAEADAYATAFMAMPLEEAISFLSAHQELDGYLIYVDDEGVLQEFRTSGFQELVLY